MKREEVLRIVQQHQTQIEQFGVVSLLLFGSVARDQAGPESDVDFLVEFSKPVGLFQLAELQLFLEDILGCRVDVGTLRTLKPSLQASVLEEAVRVA